MRTLTVEVQPTAIPGLTWAPNIYKMCISTWFSGKVFSVEITQWIITSYDVSNYRKMVANSPKFDKRAKALK